MNSTQQPGMIVLRQNLAMIVAMIVGGVVLSGLSLYLIFGFGEFNDIREYHSVVFAIIGLAASLMALVGVVMLVRRPKVAITIDDTGISLPPGNIFSFRNKFIARDDIAVISKHESIAGRIIVITKLSGMEVFVRVRFYCELDEFLSHCKAHGFPVDG